MKMNSPHDSVALEELRRENETKWETLNKLRLQISAANQDSTTTTTTSTTTHHAAGSLDDANLQVGLEVELELLQSTATWNAPTRPALHLDYMHEVVDSYEELRQTHAVLEQQHSFETRRLEQLQRVLADQKEQQQWMHSVRSSTESSSSSSFPEASTVDTTQRENDWIRGELNYVVTQIHRLDDDKRKQQARAEQEPHNPWISSKNKRPLKRQRPTHGQEGQGGSLEQLILELVQRRLASPTDPYLMLDSTSLTINKRHVEFLRRSGVVEVNQEKNMIRLSEY